MGAVDTSSSLMVINAPPGCLHNTHTTPFNNARISNILSLKLNLTNSYPCYIQVLIKFDTAIEKSYLAG